MSLGLRRMSVGPSRPSASMEPGRRFCTSTSAIDQPEQARHRRRVLQVHRDRALAQVDRVERAAGALQKGRAPAARIVAALGPLDLDHVGAEVREDLGAVGPRQILRDLDHADALGAAVSLVEFLHRRHSCT